MKYIKLGEVIYGAKTDRCGDKNFPVLSITKSDGIVLQSEKFKKRIASNDTQQYKVVKKGQLVQGIHIDEANFGIQTIVDAGIVSPAYKIWNVDESKIIPKYLEIILRSPKSIRYYSSNFNGSVKRRERLSDKDFLAMDIPCPSLLEQQKAINLIVQLKEIVNLREQELQKLDDLVKARFVEMFGTLDNPVQKFEKATLKELCNKITDGKHGGCTSEEGTKRYFVGAREIYDDEVHYDTAPEINVDEFEKDYKRCNIEIGDFLIVNTGATIGKSAIASDERTEHTLLQKSVALLKVKQELLNPMFLKWCYRVNTRMYMVESASAQPNLLLSKINATEIYVPDIKLQNQFVAFVEQVDKSKSATFPSPSHHYVLHPYIGFTNNFRRKQS